MFPARATDPFLGDLYKLDNFTGLTFGANTSGHRFAITANIHETLGLHPQSFLVCIVLPCLLARVDLPTDPCLPLHQAIILPIRPL
jgi:hypothetical protein